MNTVPDQQLKFSQTWLNFLRRCCHKVNSPEVTIEGRLTRIVGLTLEATGCTAAIGSRCLLETRKGRTIEAEVVGFAEDKTYLMPIGDMQGLVPGAKVIASPRQYELPVGSQLLGRVLDGRGQPLDGKGAVQTDDHRSLFGIPINPLSRQPINSALDVGVRAINGLLTVGRGQRMGLFAGSGVGKSVLLGMMTRYTQADVTVVGLIGERGREVNEFVQDILGPQGLSNAVVVAVPADQSPLLRLHGAMLATSIAEFFRDEGKQVLLLIDSLTRFAQAQREIALAVGEPPATKGYPPSVFAKLPQLVERAGNSDVGGGSITAFYTVLTESDDHNDPIADSARAVLDGHIVLSRPIAESGRFPAIDLEASVSRLAMSVTAPHQQQLISRFRHAYSKYQENRDLITMGVYQRGSDPEIDKAIDLYPRLNQYLSQNMQEAVNFDQSLTELAQIFHNYEREQAQRAGL